MKRVTAIETQKAKKGRVNLFLDGAFAFSLSVPVASTAGLHEGQELTSKEVEELKNDDLLHRSLNSALRYLSPRPRSEAEVRNRLRRQGFEAHTIQQVIAKLKEQKLIDDADFARFWRENRENFRPRSRRFIEFELRQKGVDAETAAEITAGLDDELNAYKAAQKKLGSLKGLDYHNFRNRLSAFLKQRGFSYEVINRIINRVWQEQTSQNSISNTA
ncbi:MAG TPA: RecX family transcriptional regulator [Dehalococcoidia bacterium]|nr:RecX family transcriptional regulator [Dehalococcoidia bacterium]